MYYIKSRQLAFMLIMMLVAVYPFVNIVAQNSQQASTRQSSMEAFSKGNYEQAYSDFSQLLVKFPKDPLYKYYSGACLVMMKKDPEEAVTLLQQSINGASVVKSLPPDAMFYLGRAQQMSGKFSEAINSYTLYSEQVGKKISREQGVPGYIQECESGKGIVTAATVKPVAAVPAEKTQPSKSEYQPPVNDSEKNAAGKEADERKELPAEYENLLDEALKLQYKADSLTLIASEQKKQLETLSEPEKASMKMKIGQNETLAASYQKTADLKYSEAQSKMNPGYETVPEKVVAESQVVKKEPVKEAEEKKIPESSGEAEQLKKEVPVALKPAGAFSFFEVLTKDAAYPYDKIIIDPAVPSGLIYRIQLAVFRNPVAPSYFKGITPVYGFKVPGTDKTNYYAGMFRRSADAKKALQVVKETGFRDAFIISMFDKKVVSADRATVLENEWSTKPLVDMAIPGATLDTIPPTLAFRVEVARSLKPLKPDAVETLRGMAGGRGLDILHLSDGNNIYLIGKFITFESAAEYADLLIRNNYRGAKVVAWLGNKEVPVETARQLFNDLE